MSCRHWPPVRCPELSFTPGCGCRTHGLSVLHQCLLLPKGWVIFKPSPWATVPSHTKVVFPRISLQSVFFSCCLASFPIILVSQAEVVQSLMIPLSPLCPPGLPHSTAQHLCNLLKEAGLRSGIPVVRAHLHCSQHVLVWHFLVGLSQCSSCYRNCTVVLLTATTQDTFSFRHIERGVPWSLHQRFIDFLWFVFTVMKSSCQRVM